MIRSEWELKQITRPSSSNSWASLPVDNDRMTNGRDFFPAVTYEDGAVLGEAEMDRIVWCAGIWDAKGD